MKWVLVALLVALLIIPLSASAVIIQYNGRNLTSAITAIDIDNNGNITLVGNNTGMIRAISVNGSQRWQRQLFGGRVQKIVLATSAPDGMFVASTEGGFVYYISAYNGVVRGVYDAGNTTGYDSAIKQGNWTDVDITDDGSKWMVVGRQKIEVKDSSNTTVGFRYQNQSDATGYYTSGALDPDGAFVITTSTSDSVARQYLIANTTTPAGWYQGYQYRKIHTITGSTNGNLDMVDSTVYIYAYNSSGVSTGQNVYLGANTTRPDYRDIRFYDATKSRMLQVASMTQYSGYTVFSLVFDHLGISEAHTIHVYYGNNSASTSVVNTTGVVASIIGPLSINPTDFNWNMEQYGNWTNSTTITGAGGGATAVATPYLPWGGWAFEGSYSLGSVTDAHNAIGFTEVSTIVDWSSDIGIPGWNGTTRLNGFGSYVYVAGYLSSSCSVSSGGGGSGYGKTTLTIGTTAVWTAGAECSGSGSAAGPRTDYYNNTATSVASGTKIYTHTHSYAISASQAVTGDATSGFDNITLYRYVDALPTHGTWSSTGTILDMSANSGYTYSGTFANIDLPWNAPLYLAIQTSTTMYTVPVSSTGFGSAASSADSGTNQYAVRIADNGAYLIEGRDYNAHIFTQAASLDGTLSSVVFQGMTAVDINSLSGLWAVAGDDGSYMYVLSKAGTSVWYDYFDAVENYSTPAQYSPCRAVAISPEGYYVAAGRMDGDIAIYYLVGTAVTTTTPTPTTWVQDVFVFKGGFPYTGVAVSVYESPTSSYVWTLKYTLTTDSNGKLSFFVPSEGYYYRFVITGEYDGIKVTSSTHAAMAITIAEQMLDYSYIVNVTESGPGRIAYNFSSPLGAADFVNVTVIYASNGTIATVANYSGVSSITNSVINTGGSHTFGLGTNYKVVSRIFYPGEASPRVDTKQVVNMTAFPQFPITGLDQDQKNALFIILLMIIAGLFSYANAHKGAIVVVMVALLLRFTGLITVDINIIILAGAFAILSAFVRGSRTP